jgi:iron complex outermembrane recepter protein
MCLATCSSGHGIADASITLNASGDVMPKPSRSTRAKHHKNKLFSVSRLAAPTLLLAPFAHGAEEADTLTELVVTATRRTESVQDVPINITALGGDVLEARGVTSLAGIMRDVPGFFVVNQGTRTPSRIVARGLNATPVSSPDGLANDAGGTVSTYLGEIPLYIDMNVVDLERVEVLLGPQGTLYGAGTLGGAVRYIPRRPSLVDTTLTLTGSSYGLSHSDGVGADIGAVLNLPLGESFAGRVSVNYTDDPGFIDYGYVVREPGVSITNPDFSNPAAVAANLRRVKDADDMQMWSGRAALRWQPLDAVDANLTYYYQKQETGARTVNHNVAMGSGRYTSAGRYLEPSDRENQLLALEIEADLGFASLTSATGASRYRDKGQRDQSDLLITLEYSYEAFPAFSAFTLDTQKDRTFNQELRLVSKTDGPLDWLVGAFFNHRYTNAVSQEFTPGYDQFAVDNFGGVGLRPDSLEYYSVDKDKLDELAFFGELSWHFNDRWQATVGSRWYKYKLRTRSAVDFPFFNTVFDGAAPDALSISFESGGQKDSGTLFKFNTSFDFTDDVMGYATVSEGYRIGNSNGVAPCPDPLPSNQIGCALPHEFQYSPDRTVNYELGLRSQWLDHRLTVNLAAYYIDWKDPQLATSTENGALPITTNGKGAESKGFEINFDAQLADGLRLWGNYALVKAELSKPAPGLIATIPDTGGFARVLEDGLAGDRLPGSPRHQGSLNLRYETPLSNGWRAGVQYSLSAVSNVFTRTGNRGSGEALGGYGVSNLSFDLAADAWTVTLYADNLFNKYAETGVRATSAYVQTVSDINGDPVPVRSYYKDVLRPREVGLRFRYEFDF